ncbi:hypothetical protein M5G11_07205, partial [Pseudomonas sp. TNT2022 ID681]
MSRDLARSGSKIRGMRCISPTLASRLCERCALDRGTRPAPTGIEHDLISAGWHRPLWERALSRDLPRSGSKTRGMLVIH